ncbi:hypothetical protein, partial [Chitinophaga sp.]
MTWNPAPAQELKNYLGNPNN